MLRSLAAILLVLLLGAAAGGAYWKFVMVPAQEQKAAGGPIGGGRGGGGGAVSVEAKEVRLGTAETTTDAVGTLTADESVVLKPEVAGRIAAINFTEGGQVTKDAVLIELDSSIERAELAQAEAQLAQARAQLVLAQNNLDRARELRRGNAGTQRALDEAQAAFVTAQTAIQRAEAEVELAQARLSKRQLRAPFDAYVGLRNVSIGTFVEAGTEIVNLEKIDTLNVDLRVPEVFLAHLDVGQRIGLTVDAYHGASFSGTVSAIDPLIDAAGRAVVVRAVVENRSDTVGNGKLPLRPGLFARARLTLAERENALFVPEQAIQPQGDSQFVFKVVDGPDGKKIAKRVPVTLGNRRAGEVEISEGLSRGDVIVTAGLLKIRDGAAVQIISPADNQPPADGQSPTAQDNGVRQRSAGTPRATAS